MVSRDGKILGFVHPPICPPLSIRGFDKVVVLRQLEQLILVLCSGRNIFATGTRVFVVQYFPFDRPFAGEFPNHCTPVRDVTGVSAVMIENDLPDPVLIHMPPMTDEAVAVWRIGEGERCRQYPKRRRDHDAGGVSSIHP